MRDLPMVPEPEGALPAVFSGGESLDLDDPEQRAEPPALGLELGGDELELGSAKAADASPQPPGAMQSAAALDDVAEELFEALEPTVGSAGAVEDDDFGFLDGTAAADPASAVGTEFGELELGDDEGTELPPGPAPAAAVEAAEKAVQKDRARKAKKAKPPKTTSQKVVAVAAWTGG